MGTNCPPLIADLFLFCYENDFMMSLFGDTQADVIEALNSTLKPRVISLLAVPGGNSVLSPLNCSYFNFS